MSGDREPVAFADDEGYGLLCLARVYVEQGVSLVQEALEVFCPKAFITQPFCFGKQVRRFEHSVEVLLCFPLTASDGVRIAEDQQNSTALDLESPHHLG